jgi:RNA polymerase sigma-70 factor (ECF subfamily)
MVPVDRDLVEQAQRGDREAFALLARTHADALFAVAQRILRDVDRAEDATQQTLVIAWRQLRRLRDPDRFVSWLHRILVNACYTELARTRRWSANVRVLAPTDYVPADELSVADRDELERGFRRLPPDQRAILVLHHYVGLAPTEIAEIIGIPPGTARSRLHYAHRAMRAALEADARLDAVAGGPIP